MKNFNYWLEEKIAFRELCLKRQDIPLFLTAQWLDAVAKDSWNVVNEYENGEIIAFFVFKYRKRVGFTILENPPLSQYSGLFFLSHFNDIKDKVGKYNKITESIINKLFLFSDRISISLHPSVTNLLPFYWAGFELHVRYNYTIDFSIKNIDFFYNLDTYTRKRIKKMSKIYELCEIDNHSDFVDTFYRFLNNRGLKLSYNNKILYNLRSIEIDGYAFESIYLKNRVDNNISALGGVILHKNLAYFLIQGHDADADNEIIIYLTYLILKFLGSNVQRFSFNGSMVKSIERRNRKFGAEQSLYYQIDITKNKILKIMDKFFETILSVGSLVLRK